MSIRCINYTLLPSGCPCVLNYAAAGGVPGSINLEGAKTVAFADNSGGFHIYGQGGQGLRVGPGSNFLKEDVDALICECSNAGPGSSPDSPAFADISPSFVSCASVVAEALPVRVVCSDTTSVSLACTPDGQLLYLDVSEFPPQPFLFDGSPYQGDVVPCERELIQHFEDYCDGEDTYTKITCVNKLDPTDVQVTWLLNSEVVPEPTNVIRCDQVCDPYIVEFTADNPENDQPFNSIEIDNDTCCALTVTTSAGNFVVKKNRIRMIKWECELDPEITITSSDEACNLADVLVTLQRTK